ncbi:unnamed protein product [Mytilus edulis]|uniref:Uncharacterized protein n=1 Tax=Mytilus edulis TaxID=6550 RepID=A0A8S3VJC9_MYTED|nr:unnamed protein product [Mytilus edulis]
MGNVVSKRVNDSVEKNFISLGHTFVWKPPGNDMQPLMENESYTILDDRLFEWLNVGSDRILSGKASQKSNWNCGYMEDKNVSVSLLQMKNLDGTNTPYIAKDVRVQERIKFDPISIKVCLLNDIQIPDLENNMVNPMKTSLNTERYVRGSSGNPNNNEMEGDIRCHVPWPFKRNLKYQ